MRSYAGETREDLRELAAIIRRELIQASLHAMGRTAPNPPVACVVVVKHGKSYRLFRGATEVPGERHAEVVALDHMDAAMWSLGDSRLYVTLEPCSTHGRTPPCTRRILMYPDLGRVAIARNDPSLEGGGIRELTEAGRRVRSAHGHVGETFLRGFLSRMRGDGPRLHLKAAVTHDDYMSAGPGERLMISGPGARDFTMALRACLDAVLVGPGTLAGDLPGLDLRMGQGVSAANRLEGRDLLCESLLEFFSDAKNRHAKGTPEHQPRRLFLAGRAFSGWETFLEKQKDLAASTGKPAEILTGAFTEPNFPAGEFAREEIRVRDHRLDLPPLDSPDFGSALRALLGELELNEVLVEGGPGLLKALEGELRAGDRIYILKSRKMVLDKAGAAGGHNAGGKKIPSYLLDLPVKARFHFHLGGDQAWADELIVKEI